MVEVQNDTILVMKSQVGQSTVKIEELRETIKARNQQIHNLELKLDENIGQMKEYQAVTNAQIEKIQHLEMQSEWTTPKIEELEKTIKTQDENIHDLESQCQLLRDAQEQHEKVIADQLKAHVQKTKKELSDARKESEEQKKQIQGLVAWVQTFRKSFEERESVRHKHEKDTSAKIRSLESAKKDQDYYKEGLEDMLSGIMEDVVEVRELVDTIRSNTIKAKTSPVKTRASA
jgi:chromosome segregation ATPase